MKTLIPYAPFIVFFFFLSGCMPIGLPALFVDVPALTYMGYSKNAFDIASLSGSGKSLSDHMLSNMTGLDCAMFNILRGNVCSKDELGTIDPIGRYRFHHLYFNKKEKRIDNNDRFDNIYVNSIDILDSNSNKG
jgi:hypothetical protein